MSKLWLLRPVESWSPWYNKAFGFVVRAKSEDDARKLVAQANCSNSDYPPGDEGPDVWLDPSLTTCMQLEADGASEIIIRDFDSA